MASIPVDGDDPSRYRARSVARIGKLAQTAAGKDPEAGMRAVASLRVMLDALEELHVRRARSAGSPWRAIADELGVSKQAVHKKYARERWAGGAR